MTRFELLAQEAVDLAESKRTFPRCYFSASTQVPGTGKWARYTAEEHRYHFMTVPCILYDAEIPRIVACVSEWTPNDVEYHVVGECPYREYEDDEEKDKLEPDEIDAAKRWTDRHREDSG